MLLLPQDAVVHRGKLIRLYKRPGHRVIINMDGDLIVRPTFAEASTQVQLSALSCLHAAHASSCLRPRCQSS